MVLDDIGHVADIGHFPLYAEHRLLVLLGRDGLLIVPALLGTVQHGLGKVEDGVEAAVIADVALQILPPPVEQLGNGKGVVGTEGAVGQLIEHIRQTHRVLQHPMGGTQAIRAVGGIVHRQRDGLLDIDDRVDAEARHALVQPPVDHFVDFLAQGGVFPVQVGLLFVEQMQIDAVVVAGELCPHAAAEIAAPVVGQLLALVPGTDVEILSVRAVGILAGLAEPLVLIGAVIYHQIHHDGHAALFALGDQALHVLHGAEAGVDIVIVGNIIPLIRHRRTVHRRKPENFHTQLLQLVQLADDAGDIADPVAVGIAKALRIDLIGGFALPPLPLHRSCLPFFATTPHRRGGMYAVFSVR